MKISASAWVSIASNVLGLVAFGLAWHGWPSGPVLSYTAHKSLHIFGVVIFMGNLIAGPLWLAFAWFSKDRKVLSFAVKTLAAADIWLTAPGVQLALWNGVFMAPIFGGVRAQAWLSESLILLLVTSVVAVLIVLPMQERFIRIADAEGHSPAAMRAFAWWSLTGTIVTFPFVRVAWLMVGKGQ